MMVITHDISTKEKMKEYEREKDKRIDIEQIKRKNFLDTKIRSIFNEYANDAHLNPSILNIKYEWGGDGDILFDAIVKRSDRFLKKDLASFIVNMHAPYELYFLEVTVHERNFQKYATIVTEEYEKEFNDKTVIFLDSE